jgi:lipopolysaccharide/colanic/teichoic acid biosynthesis glycosyltransferase
MSKFLTSLERSSAIEEITPVIFISRDFSPSGGLRVVGKEEFILSGYFFKTQRMLTGVVDVVFIFFLLITFIISIPFVWILNLLYNPGPLFYKQRRVGKNGEIFYIIKYRSMIVSAEADGIARFAAKDDDRIPAMGSFLRKSRIDELPQVINLLKGEMTLIGPRPERPEFVKELTSRDSNYRLRSLVKPGITGWAQVKYRYTATLEEGIKKLEYDLHFMKNRDFRMDLEIIGRTLVLVVSGKGT